MKVNKIKIYHFFITKIYNVLVDQILRKLFSIIPFPIVDTLYDDVCEYLQIDTSKYIESIKALEYNKTHDGWQKDYNKWLKNSIYYLYDLPRFHKDQKIALIVDALLQHFQQKN